MQLEVVLSPEELLAHLAFEPAPATVGGQVTPQITFTRKHLAGTTLESRSDLPALTMF